MSRPITVVPRHRPIPAVPGHRPIPAVPRHPPITAVPRHRLILALTALACATGATGAAGQDSAGPALSATTVNVEVTLPGSPEAIYDAITGDISGWWDHTFAEDPASLVVDARPGGLFLETFDASGDGVVHGTVIYAKRGERLRIDGPLGFSGHAVQIVTTYEFAPAGEDSTSLAVVVNAAGPLDERAWNALQAVWRHFIIDRFKSYIERRHEAGADAGTEPGTEPGTL